MRRLAPLLLFLILSFGQSFGQSCEDCENGIDDNGDGLIDCYDPTCNCAPATVTICYIPDSRCTFDCGYTFDGIFMENSSTEKLLNTNNFGAGGNVPCTIDLVPINGTITAAVIENTGCDVFFIGGFGGISLDASGCIADLSTLQIPESELNEIRNWSLADDKNLAIVTQLSAYVWGYYSQNSNTNPDFPTVAGSATTIFDGPFGTVNFFNQGACYQGVFTSQPPSGGEVYAIDSSPSPNNVIVFDNETKDLMIGDVDILTILGGITNGPNISTNNDRLFANIFALACEIVSEGEICNNGIDDDGDGLIDSDDPDCLANGGFVQASVCEGETYFLNGSSYTVPGIYSQVLFNASSLGCDSNIILDLTVNPVYSEILDIEICDGESYQVGNSFYASTGNYFDNLITINGCDSFINLNLLVNPVYDLFIDTAICQGEVLIMGSSAYFIQGTYFENKTSSDGCDSLVDVFLQVLDPQSIIEQDPLPILGCNNNSISLLGINSSNGFNTTYNWTGPCIISDPSSLTIQVDCPGTYFLEVTQTYNSVICTDISSIEVQGDVDTPSANAGSNVTLDCSTNCTSLDASNSSSGQGIIYSWSGPNSFQSDLQNPDVCEVGIYSLTVTNTNNSCSAIASVEVLSSSIPIANAGQDLTIDCNNPSVNLDGSASDSGNEFGLTWIDQNGIEVGTDSSLNVSQSGAYTLIVTNINSGCSNSDEVIVFENTNPPIANAGQDAILSCTNSNVILDGSSSSLGNDIEFIWLNENGIQLGNNNSLTTQNIGIFTLIVTDNSSGCSAIDEVAVSGSTDFPIADAGLDTFLTCDIFDITLDGSNSSTGINFSYQWQNSAGQNLGTDLLQNINTPDTYNLIVTDNSNGCSQSSTVVILQNISPPLADAGVGGTLSCSANSITLNGSASDSVGNISYNWLDSNNSIIGTGVIINVSSADTYTLLVTNEENGCSSSSQVIIDQDINIPTAVATSDDFTCSNLEVVLDGTGSSTGSNIQYEWLDDQNNLLGNDLLVTILESGTYTFLVRDIGTGCSSSSDVVVGENIVSPIVNIALPDELSCTSNQVVLDGSASSSDSNFSYEWFDSNNTLTGNGTIINVSIAGLYTLVVTDIDNGCTNSSIIEVIQDSDIPIANIDALTSELNCNVASILLQNTGSSVGNEFSYEWQNGNDILGNDESEEVDAGGTYVLVVSNTINGCSTESSFTISENFSQPQNIANSTTITCEQNTAFLDGSGSSLGSNFIYEWFSSNGDFLSNAIAFEVNQVGEYQFVVTDTNNGCSSIQTIMVDENISIVSADAGANTTLTCGISSIILDGTNSTSNANIEFEWFNDSGVLLGNDQTLETTSVGIYELIVTDIFNGCADTTIVEVLQDDNLPTPNIFTNEILTCTNSEVLLDGSTTLGTGSLSFSWTMPNGIFISNQENIEVTTAGTYQLEVTDQSNGCSATASFLVEENLLTPIADAGANDTLSCASNQAILNGSGSDSGNNFTYEWISPNGALIGTSQILNTSEFGIFTLIVTNNDNGCTSSSTTEIIQSASQPTAIILPPEVITCDQNQIELNGSNSFGIGTLDFQWYDDQGQQISNNSIINISQSGFYTLEVIDNSNNCITSSEVFVEQNIIEPIALTNAAGTITCNQDFYSVTAENSSVGNDFQYEWQDIDGNYLTNNFTYDAEIAGIYSLIVINTLNGCTAQAFTQVFEDTAVPIAIPITNDILTCDTDEVLIEGNQSVGSNGSNLDYSWFSPQGNFIGNDIFLIVSDSGTYQLVVTNQSNGCSNSSEIYVNENTEAPTPIIEALTNLNLDCNQTSIVVNGSNSTPLGNVSYEWILNNNTIANISNPQINNSGELTLVITDLQNGCVDSTSVTILENTNSPNIIITNPDLLTCTNPSIVLDASNSSTGNEFEYLWTGGGVIQNETTLTPTINESGSFILSVLDTSNGCEVSEEIIVEEDFTSPIIAISPANEFDCSTTVVTLDASNSSTGNNYSYQWMTSNGVFSNNTNTLTPNVSSPGIYTLQITDSNNGCTNVQSIIVEESDDIITAVEFQITQPFCFGDEGIISIQNVSGGTPPYLYSINNQPFSNSSFFNSLLPGDYLLAIEDAEGCQFSEEITISFVPELIASLPSFVTLELGETYELQPQINFPLSALDTLIWTPTDSLSCDNCLNPIATPINSINYQLTVVNENGCLDTANIFIQVEKTRSIFIPNGFSPNDDGINDVFYIFANEKEVKQINTFQIFSRWGELVFSQENFQPNISTYGWDVFFRGEKMNPGVFVYFAEIEFIDGVKKVYKGDVTVNK